MNSVMQNLNFIAAVTTPIRIRLLMLQRELQRVHMLLSIINEVNLTQCILISLLIRMN